MTFKQCGLELKLDNVEKCHLNRVKKIGQTNLNNEI